MTCFLIAVRALAGLAPSEGGGVIAPPPPMSLHRASTATPRSPAAPVTVHHLCGNYTPNQTSIANTINPVLEIDAQCSTEFTFQLPMWNDTWSEVRGSFLTVCAECASLTKTLALCAGENGPGVVGAGRALAGIKLLQVLKQGLPQVPPLGSSTWDPPDQIYNGKHLNKHFPWTPFDQVLWISSEDISTEATFAPLQNFFETKLFETCL